MSKNIDKRTQAIKEMREVIKYFENRDYLSFDVIYEITRILGKYKYFIGKEYPKNEYVTRKKG